MQPFKELTLRAAEYIPTAQRSGNAGGSMLRLRNYILAGEDEQLYLECYKGSLNLGETIPTEPLTGTLTAAQGSLAIVGAGTQFLAELRSGQWFYAGSDAFMVDKIADNTHLTVYRGPSVALVAATGRRPSVMFEIDRQRGTLTQGNAVELTKGSILATGFGTLRINGQEINAVTVNDLTRSVGTGADDGAVGTVAWTNPGNITASGSGVASCVPADAAITHYIKGTNCGFAIDLLATIIGIKVEIRKRLTGTITTETAHDNRVRIVKANGSIGTTDKSSADVWLSALTYSVYGGPFDLWGETWTPTDVNDADFGAVLAATVADPDTDGGTLEVDHMRVTVYYTLPASFVLNGTPQIAIYDPATNQYAIYPLGLPAPTGTPTITSVAGGTHGMQPGDYSLRIALSRSATNGYGNPGPRVNFHITNADDMAQVDTSLVPLNTTRGADGLDIYATQSAASNVNYLQGPWDYVRTVDSSELPVFMIDYLDFEINRQGILDYDNDPPGPAGSIAMLEGAPHLISCDGKQGGSPGPAIVPAKPQNIEAFPAGWHVKTSPPEDILGVVSSLARLYLPTEASLQQGVFADTGNPLIPPTSVRPYWSVGFANPSQLIFVANQLIGYPHSGPTRSVADAERVDEQFIGGQVAELTKRFVGPHVLVEHDPDPNVDAVCFFHSADSKNNAGFWQTRVLLWGVRQSAWIGEVMISNDTRDMIVFGVAKVDRHLEFLAGGRLGSGVQVDTFRWNTPAGVPVAYAAAWQLTDGGAENQNKSVRAMRSTGKFTNGNMQLFGFDSAVSMNITDIENGTNSQSGNISLGTTTDVQQSQRAPGVYPNLCVFTLRVSGTYVGSGDADRLDEVFMEYQPSGPRR